MRTVGEILKKARLEKKYTLETVEKQIKIRKKFLSALEENQWNKLPSLPYIKGFIRNYSNFLGLQGEEMLAIFRRQYQFDEHDNLLPEGITKPLNEPFIRFTPQTIVAILSFLLLAVFFIYLGVQYRSFTSAPTLLVSKPIEGEILAADAVQISGKTDSDAVVEINNKKIALKDNGEFATELTLSPGINTITIESVSKYGKRKTITRTISIQPIQ